MSRINLAVFGCSFWPVFSKGKTGKINLVKAQDEIE
jgi:hypothetical protein